ncbi:MAG: hypothetical protein H0T19_05195 [Thermoleophilaceae bacterium]|nr:hypothetical protein [Thermoleophilaceae bacterium]
MALLRLPRTIAACLTVAALTVGLSACGAGEIGTEEIPAREGLSIGVGGVDYNVFITRELNLRITPDKAYYKGPPAPPGKVLYGVFVESCGASAKPVRTAAVHNFVVEDNQGNEYHPKEMPKDNAFAYQPAVVAKEECTPEPGSIAQQGPTNGSMLLYEFPLQNTENRPLILHIKGPFDLLEQSRESKFIELDL